MGGRDPHAYNLPRPIISAQTLEELPDADPRLRVGVIDTGVLHVNDEIHPWLAGHVQYRVDEDVESDEPAGHGSFVAGVVLQQAPTATVMMRRALASARSADEDTAVADAIRLLGWSGVTLINLSFGGGLYEASSPDNIRQALEGLPEDVVVVAAAANSGSTLHSYPAGEERVLSVGAATAAGKIAEFSAHGSWIDLYAQGEHVMGPYLHGFATWSGTSFAAATVTGRIARLMAELNLPAQAAKDKLLQSCDTICAWGVNGQRQVRYLPPLATSEPTE